MMMARSLLSLKDWDRGAAIYRFDVAFRECDPLDEGLTVAIKIPAPNRRRAIARLKRYIPGAFVMSVKKIK